MTLSRWRRVATGVAAGVIVLCAALIGASFRGENTGVSVASDLRPSTTVIPIAEDPIDEPESTDALEAAEAVDTTDDSTEDPDETAGEDAVDAGDEDDGDATEPVTVIEPDDLPDAATDDSDTATDTAADPAETADTADTAAEPPLTATDDSLGTGGGVDDAECALDRLVIYAGARRGGVAGSIRNALAQAGFAAACPAPVTVLASNCPLQFAGVLGAGSGYDPMQSYVASSSSVNRETMTAVMGAVGYSGSEINILDFSFVNPDRPGEQWMAIFIPPSFTGWENLANRAGLGPTASSLCAPSGELVG